MNGRLVRSGVARSRILFTFCSSFRTEFAVLSELRFYYLYAREYKAFARATVEHEQIMK